MNYDAWYRDCFASCYAISFFHLGFLVPGNWQELNRTTYN